MRLMRDTSMETRLTETQLGLVVAELSRLAQQREDEKSRGLDREQIVQVLKELDLPVDLLDQAMEQLRQREAVAKEREALSKLRRRNIWILIAGIAVFIAVMVLTGISMSHRRALFEQISAEPGRITLAADDGGNLDKVTRSGQEVVYHVVLRNIPSKEKISLDCKWFDPTGRVFHQNSYETRLTDKSVWPTSCKCQLGSAAPPGTWRVELWLSDGHLLSSAMFEVE